MNDNVIDVILKFKEKKITFNTGREKPFLEIGINSVDQDYLIFLFLRSVTLMKMLNVLFFSNSNV